MVSEREAISSASAYELRCNHVFVAGADEGKDRKPCAEDLAGRVLGQAGEEDFLDPESHLHFIDAYEMPLWNWSTERSAFERRAPLL